MFKEDSAETACLSNLNLIVMKIACVGWLCRGNQAIVMKSRAGTNSTTGIAFQKFNKLFKPSLDLYL